MEILADLRSEVEAQGYTGHADTSGKGMTPMHDLLRALRNLPATDIRRQTLHNLLAVEITEVTSTQVRVDRLYKLVQLAELYDELLGVMTIAELEKLWYDTARGKCHTTLIRTYLIALL